MSTIFHAAVIAAAVMAFGCGGRQRSPQYVEPQPDPVAPGNPSAGQPGSSPGTPGDQGNPGETVNGSANPQDTAALVSLTGLTAEEFEQGRRYINTWDGSLDEIPGGSIWHIKSVRGSSSSTGAEDASTNTAVPPAQGTTPPATSNPGSSVAPDEVVFRIPKGTGQGAWNTKETEVTAKVGMKFVIINDDTIVHQWHTDGSPCPHGKQIPPGGREECVPSREYSGKPLYDHISRGSFYIKAVK